MQTYHLPGRYEENHDYPKDWQNQNQRRMGNNEERLCVLC